MRIYIKILYTLFGLLVSHNFIGIKAQTIASPGGVESAVEMWLKPSSSTITPFTDNASITEWLDVSSNAIQFVQNGTQVTPSISYTNAKNFYPSVYFTSATTNRKLIGSTNFNTDNAKSYYVFAVVNVETTGINTIFSFVPTYGYHAVRNVGGNMYPYLYGRQGGAQYSATNSQINPFAIVGFIEPNIYNTSYPVNVYYNNIQTVLSRSALFTAGGVALSGTPIIGNSNTTTANPFQGSIYEIIVLSGAAGNYISASDLNKLNSYLAIKYGMTIDGMTDYVNSDGTSVWSFTSNEGYNNNIFGLGKDNASGLYQNQAISSINSDFTVFVGDNLVDINENNSSTYFADKDKTYIMFGSNGTPGTSLYKKETGTQYVNAKVDKDISHIKKNILKTKITGQTTATVNMKVKGDYVVVSSENTFIPENTRIYPITDGVAKDIELNDGDYVTSIWQLIAPGGVTRGLRLWLRADDYNSLTIQPGTTNEISAWEDQTDNAYVYDFASLTGGYAFVRPTYSPYEEKMNFFPSVEFSRYSYLALNSSNGPYSEDSPANLISFVSYWSNVNGQQGTRLYTHGFGGTDPGSGTTRNPAVGFAPSDKTGRVYMEDSGSPYFFQGPNNAGYVNYSTALEMVRIHPAKGVTGGGYIEYNFSGQVSRATTVPTSSTWGSGNKAARGGTIGGASYTPNNATATGSFIGLVSDYIFYETDLTNQEIDQINTFIGMKYGITLDKDITTADSLDINFDYILSDGVTNVWKGNSSPNKAYHHNIAGIVRDDASLFVNKSKSTSSEGVIGMMSQTHTDLGQGINVDPIFKKNLGGLFWGDDNVNGKITYSQSDDECFEFTERTSRTWLVQKTNEDVMPVKIFMGKGGGSQLDNYVSSSYQAYMLIADSKEDLDNKTWPTVIPGTYNPSTGYHEFNYTFTKEYTYYTLAFKTQPSACETCSFSTNDNFTLTRSNIGTSNLRVTPTTPVTKSGLMSKNNNFTVDASFAIATGGSYMRVAPNQSKSTVRLTSSAPLNTTSTVTFKLSTPANINFAIGNIDRFSVVKVTGKCNGEILSPSYIYGAPLVTAAQKRKGYTYSISNGTVYGQKSRAGAVGSPSGMVYFDFDFAVEEITIEYSNTYSKVQRLDLFPLTLSCPKPLPGPNEDGFSMQKSAPTSVNVCDVVDFKFRILNSNSDCSGSSVYFEDTLPEGMEWVPGSINFKETNLKGNELITIDGQKLVIDSLLLPPNGVITTLRAQARFKKGAAIDTTYYNESKITYFKLDGTTINTTTSIDANYVQGTTTDTRTPIFVENDASTYDYITTSLSTNRSCFNQDGTITYTITVDNTNTAIPDMYLYLSYNENFHYIPGSFTLNGSAVSGIVELVETDDSGNELPGTTTISNFVLPQNPTTGKVIITYKIKVPSKADLVSTSVEGKDVYEDLTYSYEFGTLSDGDVCLTNSFTEAVGGGDLVYCYSKEYIISNKNVTNIIRR